MDRKARHRLAYIKSRSHAANLSTLWYQKKCFSPLKVAILPQSDKVAKIL